jgi:hypothetical protein
LKCNARELDGVVGVKGQMYVLCNRWWAIVTEGDDETKGCKVRGVGLKDVKTI